MNVLVSWALAAVPVLSSCSEPLPESEQPVAAASGAEEAPAAPESARPTADRVADDEVEPAAAGFDHAHARWTKILKQHVRGDLFDYRALAADRAELSRYLDELAAVTPADLQAWTRDQRYAFWINVYNAYCIALVVENYPLESIKDIGSLLKPVWKKRFIPLGGLDPDGEGQDLSLDVVEHGILRPRFEDARVHAAINCASESCPALRAEAFVADRLDEQLDEQVRAWLADSARNRFDSDSRRIRVSALFDWFGVDFVRDAGSVEAWIVKHGAPDLAWITDGGKVERKTLDYSWKLNELPR